MFFKNIIKNKSMIYNLSKADFKKRFVGSYFGILWMFIQPLATVLIYTFIFQVGFKATPPVKDVPYVIWLIPGIIPWFFFQDYLLQTTNCLTEYNFLVKKVVFDVEFLPIIKLLSILFSHICFIVIMFIVFIIARCQFNIKMIYIFYFSFATSVLALGLAYFTSSINTFFKDMQQIVSICLQFGMWLVPIMYDENIFVGRYDIVVLLLKLNPFYYIVKGYRYAMINDKFPDFFMLTIYFWVFTIFVFLFGYHIFNKLKNHFADVL